MQFIAPGCVSGSLFMWRVSFIEDVLLMFISFTFGVHLLAHIVSVAVNNSFIFMALSFNMVTHCSITEMSKDKTAGKKQTYHNSTQCCRKDKQMTSSMI